MKDLLKEFKYIEKINKQLPNGNKMYKYANPYNNCKDTFIINQQGIVVGASSKGDDCNVWD